jgi:hypothetical protein
MNLLEIVSIFGGITVVATGVATSITALIQKRILQVWERKETKQLEELRGVIQRNNHIVDNLTSSLLAHSQKINEERLNAIKEIWAGMLQLRESIPPLIQTIYYIMLEEEVTVEQLNKTKSNFGQGVGMINLNEFANKQLEIFNPLRKHRPLLTEKLWFLILTFQLVIGRGTAIIVNGYKDGNIKYWKKDDYFLSILAISLSKEEIEYLKSLKMNSYEFTLQLIENKALQEMNRLVTGELHTENAVDQIKKIEEFLQKKKE